LREAIFGTADAVVVIAAALFLALVKGADVEAHVPMNKRASTSVPNINLAKFGFLVIGSNSFLKWFVDLPANQGWEGCLGNAAS
jgi:hypothetical protein